MPVKIPVKITPEYLARTGTEDGEQCALFAYALQPGPGYAQAGENAVLWAMLYAIPNGGLRSPSVAARMVAMGARRGYPDIGLDVARKGFHGLRIELKKKDGKPSDVKPAQTKWHYMLRKEGYCVTICYGWEDARDMIIWYLGHGAVK